LNDARPRLSDIRNLKMAQSAHAYVRGSTAQFYEWLDAHGAVIPQGPPIWICGDCHVGNLGPTADRHGRVAVQIRDLDQTVIGNPAHDIVRLALSLASAARGWDLPGVTTARMLEQLTAGYEAALAGDFDRDAERDSRPEVIKAVVERSTRRRWRHLAIDRLNSEKPSIPLGKKFWALDDAERAGIEGLLAQEDLRRLAATLRGGGPDETVSLVDAAFWVKGCSSLGRLRYAVMLQVGEGKAADYCLIDIKEAVAAAAPRTPGHTMPRDNALRVVRGARALSPHLGKRMVPGRLLDKPVVMRELMPQDLKIEVDRLAQSEAMALAAYLAAVVGRAHGRQLDKAQRKAWLADLAKARSRRLDAPTWLWNSVVDLLSIHERAYLEHCRLYAISQAA
jgi:uncharacterized protein (DUF2252 family)